MKKPNEIDTYAAAVGNLKLFHKDSTKAVEIFKSLEGFLFLSPIYPYGTLVHFKSLNDAKRGKNLMEQKGIKTGNNITHHYCDKDFTYTRPSDELEAQAKAWKDRK